MLSRYCNITAVIIVKLEHFGGQRNNDSSDDADRS